MDKTFSKFNGLVKKMKSDLKLVASYSIDEVHELGGLTNILNSLVKDAQEIERLEEKMNEEQKRLIEKQQMEEERMLRAQQMEKEMVERESNKKDRRALKKKSLLGKH